MNRSIKKTGFIKEVQIRASERESFAEIDVEGNGEKPTENTKPRMKKGKSSGKFLTFI